MECPKCGSEVNGNFCESCGEKLKEIDVLNNSSVCRHCMEGVLVVVDSESDIPLYKCSNCNYYYGEFLNTNHMIYYDTLHLKIGRIIKTELKLKGYFKVNAKNMKDVREEGWLEVVNYMKNDLEEYDSRKIMDSLRYLEEEKVIENYIEEIDEHNIWFELRFVDANRKEEKVEEMEEEV